MKFSSIRQKLVAIISLFVVTLLMTTAFGVYYYFRETTRKLIYGQQFSMITSMAAGLDDKIELARDTLIKVAKVSPPEVVHSGAAQAWLRNRITTNSIFVHGLLILDSAGTLIASTPPAPHLYGLPYVNLNYIKKGLSSGKPAIIDPFMPVDNDHPIFMMTVPLVAKDGSISGYLCGALDLHEEDGLLEMLHNTRIGSTGYLYMFTRDRTMIMHPDNSRLMTQDVPPGVNALFDKALDGFEGSGETLNSRGHRFLSSFKRLQTTGWILASNYSVEEAYASIIRFRNYYALGILLVMLLSIAIAKKLGSEISKPLILLTSRVREFTRSGATVWQQLELDSADELGQLAASFNKLQQGLAEQLSFSQWIFNSTEAHMAIVDGKGVILGVNAAWRRFASENGGDERAWDIGTTYFVPYAEECGDITCAGEAFEGIRKVQRGELPSFDLEYPCDGPHKQRWFFLQVLPLQGKEGTVLISHTNITESMLTKKALLESEVRFRSVFDQAIDGILIVDASTRTFVEANRAIADMLGYTVEELLKLGICEIHPESSLSYVLELLARLGRGENISVEELPLLRKDGSLCYAAVGAAPIMLEGRQCMVGIFRDITESKKTRDEIRILSQAIRQSAAAVVITALDGTIEFVNPVFERITGYTAAEVRGKTPRILQSGVHPPEFYSAMWEVLRAGREWTGEICNRNKQGELYWEHVSISSVMNKEGKPTHYVAVKDDITRRKQMEDELIRARNAAEAASHAKSEFLAIMSHEIRTPMNGILGMTGLLLDTNLNAEQRKFAMMVRANGDLLLDLINDILDFSKIEAGKLELEVLDFDLRSLLEGISEFMALQADDKGLELVCRIAPDLSSSLRGDSRRLGQIVINLLGNAIKFTAAGEVVLEMRKDAETDQQVTVHCSVRDTGPGISHDKISRLFSSFEQIDASTTRKFGGTGLGLAISKRLAELMHGSIGVESLEGQGSTFWFTAVLDKGAAPDSAAPPAAELNGARVLIVDDNKASCAVLAEHMTLWGVRPASTDSADLALELLKSARAAGDPFRLVLTDMRMPGMSGYKLGEAVRADAALRGTLLILMSALGECGDSGRRESLGFAACLTKPVRRSALYDCIAAVLGGSAFNEKVSDIPEVGQQLQKYAQSALRILLAEDNEVNQMVAVGFLGRLGLCPDIAFDGQQAVSMLEATAYDLVLMDVNMPVMDGLEATRRIRDQQSAVLNHQIPIIAMTALAMQGDRENCLAVGMSDYLPKPLSPEALKNMLRKWLPQLPVLPASSPGPDPAKAATDAPLPVFDLPGLLTRLMDNRELSRKVVAKFMQGVPRMFDELREQLAGGDAERAGKAAHKIKGSAATTGCMAMSVIAEAMQAAGRDGQLETIAALMPELEKQLELLKDEICKTGVLEEG